MKDLCLKLSLCFMLLAYCVRVFMTVEMSSTTIVLGVSVGFLVF